MSSYIIHFDTSDYIAHIGNKNSGRYPRGSGERPNQHDGFLSRFRRSKNTKNNYKKSTKKVSQMNDEELLDHVQRLRLQKEAKQLSKELLDKHAFEKPKPDSVFVKAGRRIGETALAGAGLYLLKSGIAKEFDRKELANFVARGGAPKK